MVGKPESSMILTSIDHPGERVSIRIYKDLRGVETGVLHRDEGLVAGEPQTQFIQQPRRKRVRIVDDVRMTDRLIGIAAHQWQSARRKHGAAIFGPPDRQAVFLTEVVIHLYDARLVKSRGTDVSDEVVEPRRIW